MLLVLIKKFIFYGSSNYGSTRVYSCRINADNTLTSIITVFPGGSYNYINSLRVTPDNKYLLVGYNVAPYFKMYSIDVSGGLTYVPTNNVTFLGPVKRMALSNDGKYLTVGLDSINNAVQFFKLVNGVLSELTRVAGQSEGIVSTNVAISANGIYSALIYASATGLKVYKQINDAIISFPLVFSAFNTTAIHGIAINSIGSYLVVNANASNEFKLFKNTGSGFTHTHSLNLNSGSSMSLRFFEDDYTLLAPSGYTIRIIKIINDQLVYNSTISGLDNIAEDISLV